MSPSAQLKTILRALPAQISDSDNAASVFLLDVALEAVHFRRQVEAQVIPRIVVTPPDSSPIFDDHAPVGELPAFRHFYDNVRLAYVHARIDGLRPERPRGPLGWSIDMAPPVPRSEHYLEPEAAPVASYGIPKIVITEVPCMPRPDQYPVTKAVPFVQSFDNCASDKRRAKNYAAISNVGLSWSIDDFEDGPLTAIQAYEELVMAERAQAGDALQRPTFDIDQNIKVFEAFGTYLLLSAALVVNGVWRALSMTVKFL